MRCIIKGGKKMLARQHKLPVGKVGIVGYAAGAGRRGLPLMLALMQLF